MKLSGHWGNVCQASVLLVEAEWVTVAVGWLLCAGAGGMDRDLASSYEHWHPDWPSSVGFHFQVVPPSLDHLACPAFGGLLQRPLQIQLFEDPALLQEGTFVGQRLQAAG